jgi:predicted dehydrogenase
VKQVVQNLRSGDVEVVDVAAPQPRDGFVLVEVTHSLISSGTERAMVELGAKSMLGKARARPDLVRRTVDVARAEGVGVALEKVRSRLDRYGELGYSCAGNVLDGGGAPGLAPGAPVACIGAGHAGHAGVVSVPANLAVAAPAGVAAADAAFAAPAAIALHALRLAAVEPGLTVAVVGLGLIGQLAGRLATAAGATAVGTDPRADRCERFGRAASGAGFHELVSEASRGRGADAVLICAASPSSEPLELAAEVARDRAAVVVVGDVGLELDRRAFYGKELSLVVARSYGPGRYDRAFEERGAEFPAGYVRWTESRNVEAVLDLLADGAFRVDDLVTHRFPVADAPLAYEALRDDALAILLEFDAESRTPPAAVSSRPRRAGALRIGLIGAGEFVRGTLGPGLAAIEGVELAAVCARSGTSARSLAERLAIPAETTDWRSLAEGDEVDAVVIATPHAEHAEMAAVALEAGKAVLVEKPLAVDREGLARVAAVPGVLLVGHNRRFAPLARELRDRLRAPVLVQIRVAVGALAAGHWLEDPEQGGRVLGEISHFVDLASFLAGEPPWSVHAVEAGGSLAATLRFENGSAATIAYAIGEPGRLPKERIEAFSGGGALVLDDFRRLEVHGRENRVEKGKRDKGHAAELRAFVAAARGESPPPVAFDEQLRIATASLALLESARTGSPVEVTLPG